MLYVSLPNTPMQRLHIMVAPHAYLSRAGLAPFARMQPHDDNAPPSSAGIALLHAHSKLQRLASTNASQEYLAAAGTHHKSLEEVHIVEPTQLEWPLHGAVACCVLRGPQRARTVADFAARFRTRLSERARIRPIWTARPRE